MRIALSEFPQLGSLDEVRLLPPQGVIGQGAMRVVGFRREENGCLEEAMEVFVTLGQKPQLVFERR